MTVQVGLSGHAWSYQPDWLVKNTAEAGLEIALTSAFPKARIP